MQLCYLLMFVILNMLVHPRQKSRVGLISAGATRARRNPLNVKNFLPRFSTSAYAIALALY